MDENKKIKTKDVLFNIIKAFFESPANFIFTLVFILIPIMLNYSNQSLSNRILMIIGSIYSFINIAYICFFAIKKKKIKENISTLLSISILFIISVLCYINFDLWGAKDFIVGALYFTAIFVLICSLLKYILKKYEISKNSLLYLLSLSLVIIITAVINEKENNLLPAQLFYKIGVGVMYLVAITLYVQRYIYHSNNKNILANNLIGIIFFGLVIAISFPFYVQWCGLKNGDFEAFVAVYAAIIGGGITLAGVAWTIKNQEKVRKEEEKQKTKPLFLALQSGDNESWRKSSIYVEFSEPVGQIKCLRTVQANIKNLDKSNFIFKKIVIDGREYFPVRNGIAEKNKVYQVDITLLNNEKIGMARLFVNDINGFEYVYEIIFDEDEHYMIEFKEVANG